MLRDALLPEFDHEMATTRRMLERLPDAEIGWKPHDRSYTMGELATHIANIPTWVAVTLDEPGLDMGKEFPKPEIGDRDATLARFDENVAAARQKLAAAEDGPLMETWRLMNGDQELIAMPRVGVLRSFVLNHLIHHRGQLSVYLRLKDVPLPATYGPTADEQVF